MRKQMESCPTVLLKIDTGADVNLLNYTTFDGVTGDRSILQPSTLEMENYGSSRIVVLGKFFAFVRWKGKIYRQLFFVTTANTSPNLLSRDACYMLIGVVKPCYAVEAERSSLHADLQANLQGSHMVADLQTKLQDQCMWLVPNIIYRVTDHKYTALKLCIDYQMRNTVRDHPDILKQRNYNGQFIWNRNCQLWITDRNYRHSGQLRNTDRNPGVLHLHEIQHRSTNLRANLQDQLDLQSNLLDQLNQQYDLQPDLQWQRGNSLQPIQWQIQWTLSLMLISDLASKTEQKWRRNRWDSIEVPTTITDRWRIKTCKWIYSQDLQEDLQQNLQEDLQADLQPNLQVRTGLEGTQPSSLVSFPLQAETSTEERSTSMGGTCKQGPIHMTGENLHPTGIYNKDLHPTWIYNRDLHPQWIYNKPHQLTGHTLPHPRNRLRCQQQQQQHPAPPMGNPVTQSVWLILQAVSNKKWHCLQCPTMCVIVYNLRNPKEGLSCCYQCTGKLWWLFSFRQLTVWELHQSVCVSYNPNHGYDKGILYSTVCLKLTNHGWVGLISISFDTH